MFLSLSLELTCLWPHKGHKLSCLLLGDCDGVDTDQRWHQTPCHSGCGEVTSSFQMGSGLIADQMPPLLQYAKHGQLSSHP